MAPRPPGHPRGARTSVSSSLAPRSSRVSTRPEITTISSATSQARTLSYRSGNIVPSMRPVRSSITTAAMSFPARVLMVRTSPMSPPTRTSVPCGCCGRSLTAWVASRSSWLRSGSSGCSEK